MLDSFCGKKVLIIHVSRFLFGFDDLKLLKIKKPTTNEQKFKKSLELDIVQS